MALHHSLCRTSVRTWCTNVSKKKCYSSLHSFIWARIDPNRLRSAAEYSSIFEGKKKCTLPFLLEWNCMWLLWIYCKRNTSSTVLNWYEIVLLKYNALSSTIVYCMRIISINLTCSIYERFIVFHLKLVDFRFPGH